MDQTPTREILWNISHSWIMYLVLIGALAAAVAFFVRRWRLWSIGQPEDRRSPWRQRLGGALRDAVLQRRVARRSGAGAVHVVLYGAMIVMLAATALIALQVDGGVPLVRGDAYLYFFSLAVDLAGAAFCVALVACIVRRAVRPDLDSTAADYAVLAGLLLIGLTGFVLEGLRIEATDDPWRAFSPVGNAFAALFGGLDLSQIKALHAGLWWFHMVLALGLIALLTATKLVHILLVPAAVYCRSLAPKGQLPFIDMEDENLLTLGAGHLEDLTWKDLFDTQACIRCNRCQEVCPAAATAKPLSPRRLMERLGDELEQRGPIVRRVQREAAAESPGEPPRPVFELLEEAPLSEAERAVIDRTLAGTVIEAEALWSCTTCGACMEVCPAFLEHTPKIVKMRTYQVSIESAFPRELQSVFRHLETNGNPWGLGWQTRQKWAEGLEVPTLAEHPSAEYLYWPGCSGAFDSRNRKVSRALVQLLKKAGVDFAILGNEEKCCGDAARRAGNEMAYFMLAAENIATLNTYGVKKIIVQCPHCAQALERDYPQMGGHFEVIHHSVLLARLVDEGRLTVAASGAGGRATFHDSCYLGRYQDVYDAPRAVARAAGASLVEMERCRENSFCCGAGGGRMWMEESASRINDERARQALACDPETVLTSCPFCLTMLSDGIVPYDENMPVKDIAEVLAEVQSDGQ